MIEKLEKAIALMEQTNLLEAQASRVLELRERLYERELIISVMGQFKNGKSSLINALLGEELLPVGIIPLTTVVTEIRSAKNFRAVVCFTNDSEEEISRSELLDYISEQKNPDNEKQVSMVKLWTTYTPFDSDITLVDTPGVGSVHMHNTETSHAYIEKSDAVLFLLSVDSPVSEMELDFLLKARNNAAKFYFAVNKIDTISEEDLNEFLSYCKVVISKAIGSSITLFPLSTKTREGIDSLKEKLNYDLQFSYDDLLEESVSIKLYTIIAQAKSKLVLYLKAAKIPTEELKTKMSQIKEKQQLLNTLSEEFQVLVKTKTDKLVESIKEHLEEVLPNAITAIESKTFELNDQFKSLPSKQFELEITQSLENILTEEINKLNDKGLTLLQEGYTIIVGSFNEKVLDASLYISEMMMEYFDIEYPIETKTYPISQRNDNYVRLTLYKAIRSVVHLLPRSKSNSKIFDSLMEKSTSNLNENNTRIISNYRYKMRESLRLLNSEFAADISQMSKELSDLLNHIEHSHSVKGEEVLHFEEKYMLLIQQLDRLSEIKAPIK